MKDNKNKPLVPKNIEDLKAYVAGKTIAEVVEQYKPARVSKLASNENRLGFSPDVKPAVAEALEVMQDYPDPIARKLRSAISKKNGINEDQVLLASGSESILSILCRTFFLNKENAITADVTFVGFFVQIGVRGVHLKKIPVTADYRFDVKALVNAIDEHTKMIYVANPNNPTGTYIDKDEFEWMMQQVPSDVLVVMDEAYFEYSSNIEDYPHAITYGYDNVIVLRTFSKAYGLAGFRIGYAMGHKDVIAMMMKTKLTFEPTGLAQAAALAAYQDHDFLKKGIDVVESSKKRLYAFFDKHNVKYIRSVSNSVMMICDSEEEAINFTQSMLEQGVILRRINAFGLPNCIRITVGISEEMDHFEESFLNLKKSN